MTKNHSSKQGLPLWAHLALTVFRLLGLVIIVAAGFSLRLLRRAEPVLALIIGVSLCVGVMLLFGIGFYAEAVAVDSRSERPSKWLGLIRILVGLLLAILFFLGFRTEDLTIGLLPASEYGWLRAVWFAIPIAIGVHEVVAGGLAVQGIHTRGKISLVYLLAGLAGCLLLAGTLRPTYREAVIEVGERPKLEDMRLGPEGRYLAGSQRGVITVWDTQTCELAFKQEPPEALRGNNIRFYDPAGKHYMPNNDWPLKANRIAFRPDGTELAVCFANGVVKVWSLVRLGEEVLSIETEAAAIRQREGEDYFDVAEPAQRVREFRYSSDGKRLLFVTLQELFSVDMETAAVESLFKFPDPGQLATVSPDSTHVAMGDTQDVDGTKKTAVIRVWNVASGEQVCHVSKVTKELTALVLGSNGKHLAYACKGKYTSSEFTTLVDCSTGLELWTTESAVGASVWNSVTGLAISPQGDLVLEKGFPPRIRDIESGSVVYSFRQFADELATSTEMMVDWSHSSSHVALGVDGDVHVWAVRGVGGP
ncbi:MAG: hypothetical protein KDB23_08460 [Planctomycetales bacterium]|nr:hypothetical protein [Planctomycetales bacterium]